MKSFTLVTFHTDGTVFVRTRSWKHFSMKYLKAWVLDRLNYEEEWEGPIASFEVFAGIADNNFGDWYDLEPVYLDIC